MKLLRLPSWDVCEREQVLSALQKCVHFEAAPTDTTFDTVVVIFKECDKCLSTTLAIGSFLVYSCALETFRERLGTTVLWSH